MKSAILVAAILALGACNTVQGVGKDVSATGNAVTKSSEAVEQDIKEELEE